MDTKVMGRILSVFAKEQKVHEHSSVPGVLLSRVRDVKVIKRFVPRRSILKWSSLNGIY